MGHLCGPMDAHIRTIEVGLDVKIAHRFEQFKIDGAKARATQALEVLQALYEIAQRPIPEETVQLMMAGDTALSKAPDGSTALSTRRADLRVPAKPIWRWLARWTRWSAAPCSALC